MSLTKSASDQTRRADWIDAGPWRSAAPERASAEDAGGVDAVVERLLESLEKVPAAKAMQVHAARQANDSLAATKVGKAE